MILEDFLMFRRKCEKLFSIRWNLKVRILSRARNIEGRVRIYL